HGTHLARGDRGDLLHDRLVEDQRVAGGVDVDGRGRRVLLALNRVRGRHRRGAERLGDRHDRLVGAVGAAVRRVVFVRDDPLDVAVDVVGALDEPRGELTAERRELTVDLHAVVEVHDGGGHVVEATGRIVERGDEHAADDGGQRDQARDRQPGDGTL